MARPTKAPAKKAAKKAFDQEPWRRRLPPTPRPRRPPPSRHPQEGRGEEGARQEGSREEGTLQEGARQEGLRPRSAGQEGSGQEGGADPGRLPRRRAPAKKVAAKKAAPKKPAKSPFDAKFLEAQREALVEERRNLHRRTSRPSRPRRPSSATLREPGDVQFDEESGEGDTLAVERERDLALTAQFRAHVEEIDHALAKITASTYGLCEVSGLAIPKERLRAIPWARDGSSTRSAASAARGACDPLRVSRRTASCSRSSPRPRSPSTSSPSGGPSSA